MFWRVVFGLAFRKDASRVFCGDGRLAGHGCIVLQGRPPLCMCKLFADEPMARWTYVETPRYWGIPPSV